MIILGTNSVKAAGGYDVANSLRFNSGSSDHLKWTSSPSGNRQKFTFSIWFKRAKLGVTQVLASASYSSGDEGYLYISSGDTLEWDSTNSGDGDMFSSIKLRDTSAWYHLVWSVDTTQSTAGNRMKFYLNGTQMTAWSTETQPNLNQNLYWNVGGTYFPYIGRRHNGDYWGGYMAEIVQIDDAQLDATSFGEFDDSGIWKPIDVSDLTFGGNTSYYLDFEDSSALGNDAAGSNNFTVNNLTATDQSTDTCTNNFATLNPLHSIGASSELSQGNLEYDPSGHHRIISTIAPSSGKWYAEVKGIDNPDKFNAGVCYYPIPANGSISSFAFGQGINGDVGRWSNDFGIKANGDYGHNNSWSSYMASLEGENNNIVGIYMDLDNYKLYFSKNGSLVSSTGKDLTNNGYPYGFISVGEAATFQWNFGNPSFAISSGNTDDNGYGNFEYSPNITGDGAAKKFYSLNSKNLAEYGG